MNTNQADGSGEETQAEAFFEALAGRSLAHSGAVALRSAMLAESLAIHVDAPAVARHRDAETLALLVNEGVLSRPQDSRGARAAPVSAPLLQQWRERLRQLFAARSFYPALATCVAVACLVVIVPGHDTDTSPPDVLRGAAGNAIAVADPAAYALSLASELRAAGAQARLVQINDETWTLSVTAQRPEQARAAVAVLQGKGLQGITQLPVELTVRKP